MLQSSNSYSSMLHLSRPVSGHRARMSLVDRGAQFAPFAALTGYDGVILETARLTDAGITLAEGGEAVLDAALREIQERIGEKPLVRLIYFRPDARKSGGSYEELTANVRRIDLYSRVLLLTDGRQIPMDSLYEIEIPEGE